MRAATKSSFAYNVGDTCICGVPGCGLYPPDEDGPEPGDECGRWSNGELMKHCAQAGTEDCAFCPYR